MQDASFIKNSIYNVAYKLLNAIFPLISIIYASHIILANGIGLVSSAQNIAQYFVIAASLGIPLYGAKHIARAKDDNKRTSKTFSELFVINLISTLICTTLYYLLINNIIFSKNGKILYDIIGIHIILNIFNIDWFYQGTEKFKYIVKRDFIVKAIALILLFIFVQSPNDYLNYAIIYIIATAGNYIFNMLHLKRSGISLVLSDLKLKKHLKPLFILFGTVIAIELYTLLDTTMLTIFCPSENVGYYTNTSKMIKVLITIITAIGGTLLPRLSYNRQNNKIADCEKIINTVLSVLVYLFLPCGLGVFLLSDLLVPILFGQTFIPAILTLKIAVLLIYALGFSNLFGTQVLLAFDCEKKLFICTLIGAASNIIINLILIPLYQQNGAMTASVISETLVTLFTFYFSCKFIKYHLNFPFIIKTIISCLLMSLTILILRHFISASICAIVLSTAIGALVYFLSGILIHNEVTIHLFALIKSRSEQ